MKGIYRSNNALGLTQRIMEEIKLWLMGGTSIIQIKQLTIIPLGYQGGAIISPINTKVYF